ncbi:putative D-aminoacylase [Durotheca rogersii]|uniref:putative D-aminoacylase n=1 Tax=Durotheca rogersii TaxID=419775 RepID=UPI00221EF857|nr:putative D-aminoacylase [Durotheca rogersii]KAI5865741.1 putative D-aminoacylase [Durotheca rogersii]
MPPSTMAGLSSRIDALRPKIEELMRIGGTPGLSLGIMHQGERVYYASYGYRDVEQRLPLTDETILPVCSLTKAVTSAALGILVDEKKSNWDTLVKDALPSFNIKDDILQNHMTLSDLLCHRSGMSWGDNLIIGTENNILISEKDSMAYLNSQTRLLPFRGQFAYNNLAYELAGKVIESLSQQSYFDFVQSRILDPLGMTRTYLKTPPSDLDNVGKCYNALGNGTSAPVTCVQAGNDWFGTPHAGMRSCVSDLMKLYKAFMTGFNDQIASGKTSTDKLPLKQVSQLMSAKIFMDQPSRNEASYGFGWGRVQLPGRLGQIGINPGLMPNGMPIVGKGVAPRLVIFHQGSLPGALSLNLLLPDTESAIVISSNALALNDVPDWVGQLVLEEFLEVPESQRNDYIEASKISSAENLKWYPNLIKELQQAQRNGTSPKELESYVGTYWDRLHIFKIVVTVESGALYWALQGLESEKFRLSHYEDDVFTWLQPREELSRRGRWVGTDQGPSFWKVEFKIGEAGKPNRLYWVHDNDVPAAEYSKE